MKEVWQDGCIPARVPDAALGLARLPFEQRHERRLFAADDSEHTITKEQYDLRAEAPESTEIAPAAASDALQPAEPARYDDFTVDAEILVERLGSGSFTTSELARVLGVRPKAVHKGVASGFYPKPRTPTTRNRNLPGHEREAQWSKAQVVEILATRLRKAAAA